MKQNWNLMGTRFKSITIDYSTEIDESTFKPLKIITLKVDLENLEHLKILYGDGITMETMQDILSTMILRKYSTENFVFGSGGFLMQQHDRDSLAFAIKCSSIEFNDGTSRDVFKDPITAPNKVSKKGRVIACIDENGEYTTCLESEIPVNSTNALHLMFVNGKLVNQETFFEIRDRANNELLRELNS